MLKPHQIQIIEKYSRTHLKIGFLKCKNSFAHLRKKVSHMLNTDAWRWCLGKIMSRKLVSGALEPLVRDNLDWIRNIK